jgi:hypothetical protein
MSNPVMALIVEYCAEQSGHYKPLEAELVLKNPVNRIVVLARVSYVPLIRLTLRKNAAT